MNISKKLLCLLLALVCCLGVLAGCNKEGNDTTDETETKKPSYVNDNNETQPEDIDPSLSDDLKESYDFGKAEYAILCRKETGYEFTNEAGMEGTPIEQAIFKRNEYVNERCNVIITVDSKTRGDWWNRERFMTEVRKNHDASTSEYSLIATHASYLTMLGIEGMGYNLNQLPDINFEKRWWCEQYYEAANYNGAVYSMFGDIAYSLYEYMMVIFYNEKIAEDLSIPNLYEVVIDGDWTFEALKNYTTMVTTDLNLTEPEYGFLANGHGSHAYVGAFQIDIMPLVEDRYTVSRSLTEEVETPMSAVISFVRQTPQVRIDFELDNSKDVHNPLFAAGRSLFYQQMLGQAMYFKEDMKDSFGVLPYPKYNDLQVEYSTDYCDDMTGILVPRKIANPQMVGTVTEMLCMESYNVVVNQFYEINLKYHAFNDPLCIQSLEIIRTSLSPYFAKIYGTSLGSPQSTLGNIIEHKFEIGSYWTEQAPVWEGKLKDLYRKLDALEAMQNEPTE